MKTLLNFGKWHVSFSPNGFSNYTLMLLPKGYSIWGRGFNYYDGEIYSFTLGRVDLTAYRPIWFLGLFRAFYRKLENQFFATEYP